MEFQISIEQFEGPLDLMLHLIKTNKLDLFDLDMNVLATQYIEYIAQMEQMQLEIASEYLSELAGLIEYKSSRLLPRTEAVIEQEYEELKIRYEQRQRQFTRPASSLIDQWSKPKEEETLSRQSVYELAKAFERILHRLALLNPYETKISIREISVEERAAQIVKRLELFSRGEPVSFEQLCQDCTSLHMVIVTFLGILDLIHDRSVSYQVAPDNMIYIMKGAAI